MFVGHAQVFDEFFYLGVKSDHFTVSIAKGDAESLIEIYYPEIAIAYQTHWPILPFPNTVVFGNGNLRLDIPDSAYILP